MIFVIIIGVLLALLVGYSVLVVVVSWFLAKALFLVAAGGIFILGVMLLSGDPTMVWSAVALIVVLLVLIGLWIHDNQSKVDE